MNIRTLRKIKNFIENRYVGFKSIGKLYSYGYYIKNTSGYEQWSLYNEDKKLIASINTDGEYTHCLYHKNGNLKSYVSTSQFKFDKRAEFNENGMLVYEENDYEIKKYNNAGKLVDYNNYSWGFNESYEYDKVNREIKYHSSKGIDRKTDYSQDTVTVYEGDYITEYQYNPENDENIHKLVGQEDVMDNYDVIDHIKDKLNCEQLDRVDSLGDLIELDCCCDIDKGVSIIKDIKGLEEKIVYFNCENKEIQSNAIESDYRLKMKNMILSSILNNTFRDTLEFNSIFEIFTQVNNGKVNFLKIDRGLKYKFRTDRDVCKSDIHPLLLIHLAGILLFKGFFEIKKVDKSRCNNYIFLKVGFLSHAISCVQDSEGEKICVSINRVLDRYFEHEVNKVNRIL